MKKLSVFAYIGAFLGTVILAVALLVAAAFLPQEPIDQNVKKSAEMMMEEGVYPYIADKTYASRLDNWSESIMLMECKAMTAEDLETIFSNPRFETQADTNAVERLYSYVQDDDMDPAWYYVRYWLGFRTYLRLALVFMNYYQLRRYLAFVFFALFAAVIGSLSRQVNKRMALVFAICIALVRPQVISNSLQFSCCFLIAFIAMLMIPWLNRNSRFDKLFFLELGILTMYFDFYTTPVITLGLPLSYLYMLRSRDGQHLKPGRILADSALWFTGYGLMWVIKLVLATLFTSENGFYNGFGSMFGWLGVMGIKKTNATYDVGQALERVALSVYSDDIGKTIWLIALAVLAAVLIWMIISRRISLKALNEHKIMLLLAAMPVVWFCATAAPTYTHFWFQYRSVAMLFWCIGAYFCMSMPGNQEKLLNKPQS